MKSIFSKFQLTDDCIRDDTYNGIRTYTKWYTNTDLKDCYEVFNEIVDTETALDYVIKKVSAGPTNMLDGCTFVGLEICVTVVQIKDSKIIGNLEDYYVSLVYQDEEGSLTSVDSFAMREKHYNRLKYMVTHKKTLVKG